MSIQILRKHFDMLFVQTPDLGNIDEVIAFDRQVIKNRPQTNCFVRSAFPFELARGVFSKLIRDGQQVFTSVEPGKSWMLSTGTFTIPTAVFRSTESVLPLMFHSLGRVHEQTRTVTEAMDHIFGN